MPTLSVTVDNQTITKTYPCAVDVYAAWRRYWSNGNFKIDAKVRAATKKLNKGIESTLLFNNMKIRIYNV